MPAKKHTVEVVRAAIPRLALWFGLCALSLVPTGGAFRDETPVGALAYVGWPSSNGQDCLSAFDLQLRLTRRLVCAHIGDQGGQLGSDIAWSPDGSQLAYINRRVSPGMYVVAANGTAAQLVIPLRRGAYVGDVSSGSWSPDGTRLLFNRWAEAGHVACTRNKAFRLRFAIAQVASKRLVEIPVFARLKARKTLDEVEWSPRGDQVLYVIASNRISHSYGTAYCDDTAYTMYMIGADGRNRRVLATVRKLWLAAWSPDGSTVAYTGCDTRATETCGLHTVSIDGTDRRLLFRMALFGGPPGLGLVWTHSGREILVQGNILSIVDVSSGTRRRLALPLHVNPVTGCGPEETLLDVSSDERWIGVLSQEDFTFDDCKDPISAVISLVPLDSSAGQVISIPVAPKPRGLDSVALYLR
jgi:dipeptidyl aminopeptidase/acylaminoacyl peptidase